MRYRMRTYFDLLPHGVDHGVEVMCCEHKVPIPRNPTSGLDLTPEKLEDRLVATRAPSKEVRTHHENAGSRSRILTIEFGASMEGKEFWRTS